MKMCEQVWRVLGIDFVEKTNHGGILKLYERNNVVVIKAVEQFGGGPFLDISIEEVED